MYKLLIPFVFLLFLAPTPVLACSGLPYSYTPEELIAKSDLIVDEIVVERDDAAQNGVIYVEQYLKGEGPRHLLLYRTSPRYTAYQVTFPPDTCYWLASALYPGRSYTLALKRLDHGGYAVIEQYSWTQEIATHDELVAKLAELTGQAAMPPQDGQIYPRKHPLLIETEAGDQYIFPVDDGPLRPYDPEQSYAGTMLQLLPEDRLCTVPGCVLLSPDETQVAMRYEDQRIEFFYDMGVSISHEGEALVFSRHNDRAAIWQGDQLQVIGLPGHDLLESIDLKPAADYSGVWTFDNLFLYSDGDGIWIWEMFYTGTRELLIPAEEEPLLIEDLLYKDRYLVYRRGAERVIYNLHTGDTRTLSGELVEWTERHSVIHWHSTESGKLVEVCPLSPGSDCYPLLETAVPVIQAVVPFDQYEVGVVGCHSDQRETCLYQVCGSYGCSFTLALDFLLHPERYPDQVPQPSYALAYQRETGYRAHIIDGSILHINNREYDLSEQLDSPMRRIEWLPSLFYRHYQP